MLNNNIIISGTVTMLDAISIMDRVDRKLLIVCEGTKLQGVISIGDIQRAIINKQNLSLPVSQFVRKKITLAKTGDDLERVKNQMRKGKIEAMPIVDDAGNLIDIIEWDELFPSEKSTYHSPVELPVIIMAGGKGTRLLPLTHFIPKPLVPISEKTIIEEILTRFKNAGCRKFYISINYMGDKIRQFFSEKKEWDIDFIEEQKPLGTGGSLFFLKGQMDSTFFVTNCDALIDIDLGDLLDFHKKNRNSITIVSTLKSVHIPYGTLETGINGVVKTIHEKPDYVYQINSGFYVFEPDVLDYIEDDSFQNITDVIVRVIESGKKVGAFPVSEGSWTDMGNWEEYVKIANRYLSR